MTQNTGWSPGGNDGLSDATRPLQSVNGQPNYQGYQQAGYQASQNGYSQAYPQNGYGYRATATVASPAPEKSKRYGGGVVLTAAVLAALVGGVAHRIRRPKMGSSQQSSLLNRKLCPSLPASTLFFVAVLSALREIMGL